MTTQHSDARRDPAGQRSEVLSDTTDLDALMEAILGDPVSPIAAQSSLPTEVSARTVAAGARLEPAVVASRRIAVDLEHAFARGATAHDNDVWEFVSEDPQPNEIVPAAPTVRQVAVASPARALPQRTWRDRLGVAPSKRSVLVAGLSAAALITLGVIALRQNRTETATIPSAEAPAPVEPSPPVQPATAVAPTDSSDVEVWAAAREPKVQPRVISRTPPGRPNEATTARTTSPRNPAVVDAPRSAPTASSPVLASPAPVERVAEPTNREAAPTRTAAADAEKPKPVVSEPTVAASGVSVTNPAEPAAIAAAPVPAVVPRRSEPRLLTGGSPEYPAALRTAKIGGSVEVRFTIDATGRVTNVQSLTGPLQLRSAAEAAVRRWRYEAARVDNLAVETQTSVRFNFDPSPTRRPQE